ncbi:MAG: cobalamin B12-binding domain-containing protein [Tissierellia bacterium]|jgi:methanogenic corrinoid protein MtbC1|nr:cobalamin B12-binding domain-containing protein [Tissierellia bacterium]
MHPKLTRLIEILETEDRAEALRYVLDILDKKEMTFIEVYEQLLTPSLNQMIPSGNEDIDIWNEHIRTSIIKTIVENTFSYVMAAREQRGKTIDKQVAILTPPSEFHSVGARMVKDVFTYLGYDAIYVGGNTPLRVLEAGMASRPIDYVVISVSNPYHLISTRNMIEAIRAKNPSVTVIVGGNAIHKLGDKANTLQADLILTQFEDLERIETGDTHETGL